MDEQDHKALDDAERAREAEQMDRDRAQWLEAFAEAYAAGASPGEAAVAADKVVRVTHEGGMFVWIPLKYREEHFLDSLNWGPAELAPYLEQSIRQLRIMWKNHADRYVDEVPQEKGQRVRVAIPRDAMTRG